MDIRCAGVLPIDDQNQVLLGWEEGAGWSSFSGKGEDEDQSDAEIAARELCEESCGVINLSLDVLRRCLVDTIESKTSTGKHHVLFVVRVTPEWMPNPNEVALSFSKAREAEMRSENPRPERLEKLVLNWFHWRQVQSLRLRRGFFYDWRIFLRRRR